MKRSLRHRAYAVGVALLILSAGRAQAANITWTGGGATNNWSDGANWSTASPPGSSDKAVFDGTSVKNATWDASGPATITALSVKASYTGTITLGRDIIVAGNWSFAGSGFTAASHLITLTATGTFKGGSVSYADLTINAPSSNVTFSGTNVFTGNLTMTDGTLKGGTIDVGGNITCTASGAAPTTSVVLNGSSPTYSGTSSCTLSDDLTVNVSGTLTLSGTIQVAGSWTWTSGALLAGASTLDITDSGTISPGTVTYHHLILSSPSTTNFLAGTTMTVGGDLTLNGTGKMGSSGTIAVAGNVNCTAGNANSTTPILLNGINQTLTGNSSCFLVIISWHTGYETDLLGFNLYRSDGGMRKLNSELILGSMFSSSTTPYFYSWIDAAAGATTVYWLEELELNGSGHFYGPVAPMSAPNASEPSAATPDDTPQSPSEPSSIPPPGAPSPAAGCSMGILSDTTEGTLGLLFFAALLFVRRRRAEPSTRSIRLDWN